MIVFPTLSASTIFTGSLNNTDAILNACFVAMAGRDGRFLKQEAVSVFFVFKQRVQLRVIASDLAHNIVVNIAITSSTPYKPQI